MLNLKDFPPFKAGELEVESVLFGGRRVMSVKLGGVTSFWWPIPGEVGPGAWVLLEEYHEAQEVKGEG